jgi:hypothetical protein
MDRATARGKALYTAQTSARRILWRGLRTFRRDGRLAGASAVLP